MLEANGAGNFTIACVRDHGVSIELDAEAGRLDITWASHHTFMFDVRTDGRGDLEIRNRGHELMPILLKCYAEIGLFKGDIIRGFEQHSRAERPRTAEDNTIILVAESEYHDETRLKDPVWLNIIIEYGSDKLTIGKMVKSGLVVTRGSGRDATIELTDAGVARYNALKS